MTAAPKLYDDAVGPRPWHVTTRAFWEMVGAGLFEGQRVELIKGVVVEREQMKPPHGTVVSRLTRRLSTTLGMAWAVRVQVPLDVGADSVPVPDFVVMPAEDEEKALPEHPTTAPFVCEVADTSLLFDRREKLPLYAASGVAEYVIVNIPRSELEVYSQSQKRVSAYKSKQVFKGDQPFVSKVLPGVVLRSTTSSRE